MRVAILAHSVVCHDAVGNQAAEKALFFQERGAEVRVFVHDERSLQGQLHGLATRVHDVHAAGALWEYLKDCDLVVAEFSQYFPLLDALPALARLTRRSPRIVVDYHGVTPPELADEALRPVLTQSRRLLGLIWCADAVLTHSQHATDELVAATGYPRERIRIQDLPVEDGFAPAEVRARLAERLGVAAAPIALFVGRLAANKRPEVLVEAVARLRAIGVHAVFVGAGGDVYARQVECCRELAARRGVAERVHFLGQLPRGELIDAYRSAAMLVLPSRHEGFGLPVREAMACGLPVIAARSAALPETVGDAGLTFEPDDANDLATQMARVLSRPASALQEKGSDPFGQRHETRQKPGIPKAPGGGQTPFLAKPPASKAERTPIRAVAVVAFRFGPEIIGGAERSLRRIATTLARRGVRVEVFTTCTKSESDWRDEMPPGMERDGDLMVHRFRVDPHDRESHLRTLERLRDVERPCPADLATAYLEHSIHSGALLEALARRIGEFQAVITGPYLFGLVHDVACRFSEKTLLLPCFHDEPIAWLPAWPRDYGKVAGILYHSPEEQDFAQTRLGVNHPNSGVIGAWLPPTPAVQRAEIPGVDRYVVYCGRYSAEKDVPRLLDYAERYLEAKPGRLAFVFMGAGDIKVPRCAGILDLGRVSEERKASVLRGAAALVQLSRHESLSLVALEAWSAGTPVITARHCAVLRGQVERSGGGWCVDGYDEFAKALDRLVEDPAAASAAGSRGREYVERHYSSEEMFARAVLDRVETLSLPLAEQMRRRGLARARRSDRAAWREAFGAWMESVLDAPDAERTVRLRLQRTDETVETSPGGNCLIAFTIHNEGTLPLVPHGPGRTSLRAQVRDATATPVGASTEAELPELVVPGRSATGAILVRTPQTAGDYTVTLESNERDGRGDEQVTLRVRTDRDETRGQMRYLEIARRALAAAHALKRLPDDYVDVTEGWLARIKRWIKQKLLGNFRRGYVDVLSRQQSQVNQQLVEAVQQLTHCCATLAHAIETLSVSRTVSRAGEAARSDHDATSPKMDSIQT